MPISAEGRKRRKRIVSGILLSRARVDQRLIEGDVGAPAAQAGVDHAERLAWRFAHVMLSACCS